MTVTDDEVEVPDAAPLPAEDLPPPAEGGGESTHDQDQKKKDEEAAGPPPLPPLLEAGASSMVTAGSGIYAAAGPAGLVAAMGVATVAGVAYGVRRSKKNATNGRGGGSGIAGRFFGTPGAGAGGRRGGRFGSLSGGRGGGRGAGGAAGLGRGRHRSAAGSGGLTGAAARAARRNGTAGRGLGSSGARSGSGTGRLFGPGGPGRSGGSSLLGGGRGAAGSRGSGLFGGGSRSGPGAGRSGLFGGSTSGSRSGRSGGLGSSRRSGISGGGLFGGAAGRSARRGRVTAISDPAARTGTGRGRGHHRLRRVVKRGWEHPRIQRTRVRARKGLHKSRVRIRSHSKRLGDYLRRRKWTLRVKGWGHSFADWWSGIWSALTGRASDPRYGRLHGWQLGAAAVAIGALGAGKRKAQPRVLTGRIIGTAAPTPGQDGPITMAGRKLLALATGEGDETLAPEVQRIKDAADELKEGLARLGMSEVGMLTYEQALKQISPILGIVADGLKDLSTTAEDEQPLDPTVIEFMHTIEGAARGASEVADELPGLFRAAHEVELRRLETPRRGEHKWDVTQN